MYDYKKICKEIDDECINNYGYICCQVCERSNGIFHHHHICYRSEYPNHEEMHNKRNVLLCCNNCHDSFHADKKSRNYLIEERELFKIFKNIYGYDITSE